jgi:Flp pilus assembly protein TadB
MGSDATQPAPAEVFIRSEAQALAVFNHAGQEIRFYRGQQWQVTHYALLACAALAAAPQLIVDCRDVPNCACIVANVVAIVFVALAAIGAWWVVRSLGKSHEKELKRMEAASKKLPVVREIHDEFSSGGAGRRGPAGFPG